MNHALLKTELENDLYHGKAASECAALLNDPTIAYYVEVETSELTNFLMNSGLYAKLLAVYRDHPNPQVRVVAESALDLAQSQIKFVNVKNSAIQTLLPALVQGGVWTQPGADSVVDFAKRVRSRAVELLGDGIVVTEQDVNAARWLDQINAFDAHIALVTALRDDMASGNAYHELSEAQ